MVKNLVLVKFNQSADKCYLFEIPTDAVVFAGEILLVKNHVGQEQEVFAVCDSFAVIGEKALDRTCWVNGTKADNLKKAVGFVNREIYFYDYDEEKIPECTCDKDPREGKHFEDLIKAAQDKEKAKDQEAYEISREIAQAVADVCGDLGVDCGKIVVTISDDDEEGED